MDPQIKITADPKDFYVCKFTVDRPVLAGGSAYFGSAERAKGSPLAEKILAITGMTSVLIQDNLVTVESDGTQEWKNVGREIGAAIRSSLTSGAPVIADTILANVPPPAEIRKTVEELLASQINPAIAAHGGWVELIDVRGNEVYVRLGGGCQGCGSANVTLKQGIEKTIRDAAPYVGAILDTTDHAAGRNPYYSPSK